VQQIDSRFSRQASQAYAQSCNPRAATGLAILVDILNFGERHEISLSLSLSLTLSVAPSFSHDIREDEESDGEASRARD
jgi:hypothetical protein